LDTTFGGAKDSFSTTVEAAHGLSYSLHLNVFAVSKEISALGVYLRFLKQIEKIKVAGAWRA